MITALVAWFGPRLSSIWLKVVAVAGILLAIFLACLKLISIGRDQQRAAEDKARLDAVEAKKETDHAVDGMGDPRVADELRQWMRDDTAPR